MDSCRQCGCAGLPRTEMLRLGSPRQGNSWSSSGTTSVSTFGMRKKSSSRFSSGTCSRSLLSSARHASNTCSWRGSLAHSTSPWRPGSVDRETLHAAGGLLDAHIRLEERQLFPLIERLVPDEELRRLGLASRDVTCTVRQPAP